ncbi:MAG: hypothetical protein V1874_15235 [Spirochaetota bacterium]
MKTLRYLLIALIFFSPGCKKENNKNKVPLEQLNIDKSSNYQYILKDVIEKQNKREEQNKKDPFKD